MQEAGLEMIETYITNHHKNISQYIVTSPILELYMAVERQPGLRVLNWWLLGIVVRLEGKMVLWSAQILEYVDVRTMPLNWRKEKINGRLGAMLMLLEKMCRFHEGKIDS